MAVFRMPANDSTSAFIKFRSQNQKKTTQRILKVMMINGKSIVVFLATITLSQCIFKIKDLQRMVSSADDRLELKLLNKQDNIPRNEIKKKVDAIVQKQPSDVQVVVFFY